MDSCNRALSNKFQSSKNQKSFRSNLHGRSNENEIKLDRDHNDDYYTKKSNKSYSDYPMTKYQQNHGNKSSSDNKSRYDRGIGGGGSVNFNQRQGSETRSNQDLEMNRNHRDNRSQEPTFNHYKPPIGQNNSNSLRAFNLNPAALSRLPLNIDNLPPRLKKKQLLDAGLPEDLMDKKIADLIPQSYSNNALPIGRNNRNNRYDHQQSFPSYSKYGNQQNFDGNQNYRSITPPPSKLARSNATPSKPQLAQSSSSSTSSSRYEPIQRRDDNIKSVHNSDDIGNFDWSEDVMSPQSLPFEVNANHNGGKFDDNSRGRQRRRNRSVSSNRSVERSSDNYQSNFKKPYPPKGNQRQRRNSQSSYNSRENSMERSTGAGYGVGFGSRENSLDRHHHHKSRYNGRRGSDYQSSRENSVERYCGNWSRNDSSNNLREEESMSWRRNDSSTDQKIAALTKDFKNSVELNNRNEQKRLFDPRNPDKPIVVTQSLPRQREYGTDNFINSNNNLTKPEWMKKSSKYYQEFRKKQLLDELSECDDELMILIERSQLLEKWSDALIVRKKIQEKFQNILANEMRFCQAHNVENFIWKILFHRIIEWLRNQTQDCNEETVKQACKVKALEIVENGIKYYESVINFLEEHFNFKIDNFIGENAASYTRGLGYVGCALVSSQKIFVNLGDLARYREQINQTNNFGRAKNFYVKAQQVVPNNGLPFNQLALLACYSKRKFDAVYFYMRSLMSSNPFEPAKESLCAVFDDIRKKYEVSQRKRDEKNRSKTKEKEQRFDGNFRKETWIHPEGGSRFHRTAPLNPSLVINSTNENDSSNDEELQNMDPSELNKRFVISFLHVQGKLINNIGMESFQTCATQMLKEFRALLHISPIPVNSHRLLQLISMNMYAIANSQIKDQKSSNEMRSEVQECAIAISLLMFGIILERFIEVIKETSKIKRKNGTEDASKYDEKEPKKVLILDEDSKVMLPAIKSWCDWMMFHIKVWNPPPPFLDYKISSENNYDPWNGLATLMTILETTVDINKDCLTIKREKEDFELVRLQEDVTLAGFTPLKNYVIEPIYCRCDIDIEIAQNALRMQKLKFFGTSFLCECELAILKKVEKTSSDFVEYVSIVQNRSDESNSDSDIFIESFSDDETTISLKDEEKSVASDQKDSKEDKCNDDDVPGIKSHSEAAEIRRLLRLKDELQRKEQMEMKYKERLKDILSLQTVVLHIDIHPRYLIPDTNCFVDDLTSIKSIANAYPLYQLMIPITVISELEGLSRGIKPLTSSSGIVVSNNSTTQVVSSRIGNRNDPQHAAFVARASKEALEFLNSMNPAVKCVTAKGSVLPKLIFTNEDTSTGYKSNDDIILDTALSLCKKCNIDEKKEGEVRYLVREVVLLTTDRNLRVKALTNDIPVRELLDFIKWAGLGYK